VVFPTKGIGSIPVARSNRNLDELSLSTVIHETRRLLASRGGDVRLNLLGRQTVTLREDFAQIDLSMSGAFLAALRFLLWPIRWLGRHNHETALADRDDCHA
jgi:hypothetical protein